MRWGISTVEFSCEYSGSGGCRVEFDGPTAYAARRFRSSSENLKPTALSTANNVESLGLPFGESAR
mgnify:CR=1 FL=1